MSKPRKRVSRPPADAGPAVPRRASARRRSALDPEARPGARWRWSRRDVWPLVTVLGALALGTIPLYWAAVADLVAPLPEDQAGPQALTALNAGATAPPVLMYRSPTCQCCARWAGYMRRAGFAVTIVDTAHVTAVRRAHAVPDSLAACHTATVAGYVVEGHVPAADVARLVVSRPRIRGLALPGMPRGSPGMESALRTRFAVRAFDSSGAAWVVARH